MSESIEVRRREALRALVALAAAAAAPSLAASAGEVLAPSEAEAFEGQVARVPWLAPFKGLSDAQSTLRCESLALSGRWPAGLRGRFYRNGPALYERNGQRYHHWFDGDGMLQQFTFGARGVSHVGRLVATPKLAAEQQAGRFLYSAFGTGIQSDAPVSGPDSFNTANTNAIEHAGRVLALWEGGSAFALDPKDLATLGPVTWKEGYEQVPFSAHPKVDATGHLWNIGTFGDKIVVWHVDPQGRLASVQVSESPYPNGLAHDVAVTPRYIVLPLPPVKMDYAAVSKGATPEQAFRFERGEPLRVLVMSKADIRERRVFELPARMVFHVGNAFERADGNIALTFIGSENHEFLVRGAVDLAAGRRPAPQRSSTHSALLEMATGRAKVETFSEDVEFPRVDPRRIGLPARHLVSAANWKYDATRHGTLFHGLQSRDLQTGRVDRFDYGERMVVEEHIVVPKPRSTNELDAWLVGTTFDSARKVTLVNVLDARRVAEGPIAQAALPYWLPLGFHGNFTALA